MSYGKEMPQGSKTRLGGTHTQSHIIVDDIDVGHETVSFRLGEKKQNWLLFNLNRTGRGPQDTELQEE